METRVPADPYITNAEAAKLLSTSRAVVSMAGKAGRIRRTQKPDGYGHLYSYEDVIDYKEHMTSPQQQPKTDLISVREAATLTNRSLKTFTYHIKAGNLKAERVARKYYFKREDLDEFEKKYLKRNSSAQSKSRPTPPTDDLLAFDEACAATNRTRGTLEYHVKNGNLKAKKIGGRTHFRRVDLDEFNKHHPKNKSKAAKAEPTSLVALNNNLAAAVDRESVAAKLTREFVAALKSQYPYLVAVRIDFSGTHPTVVLEHRSVNTIDLEAK